MLRQSGCQSLETASEVAIVDRPKIMGLMATVDWPKTMEFVTWWPAEILILYLFVCINKRDS